MKKSFGKAFLESFRLVTPHYVFAMVLFTANVILSYEWFHVASVCLVCWIGLGSCIVFVVLKKRSAQNSSNFDFLGAANDIYCAMWWPWYLKNNLDKRGIDE